MIRNKSRAQVNDHFQETQDWKKTKKVLLSPKRKYFKMNFHDNSLSPDIHEDSVEEEKLKQYIEQIEKDHKRYSNFKDTMKKRYFNIRTTRQNKINQPQKLKLNKSSKTHISHQPLNSQCFLTERRMIASKEDFSDQFQKLLALSHSAIGGDKKNKKVRTRSQINKKDKQIIENEKKLIIKLIKKSQSVDMNGDRKWDDLTAKDKYLMNFSFYLKKKTQAEIDKDIYDKKIRKKTKPLQQFQDFILQEVKFSNENKQKLDHFFRGIRSQFKRVETHRG